MALDFFFTIGEINKKIRGDIFSDGARVPSEDGLANPDKHPSGIQVPLRNVALPYAGTARDGGLGNDAHPELAPVEEQALCSRCHHAPCFWGPGPGVRR